MKKIRGFLTNEDESRDKRHNLDWRTECFAYVFGFFEDDSDKQIQTWFGLISNQGRERKWLESSHGN